MNQNIKEFALEWIKTAEEDLLWGKASFEDGFYSRVCFICHQCVEKSIKGFLYFYDKRIKTHNLTELLTVCVKIDKEFASLEKYSSKLNPYYLETRYPDMGDVEKFNKKEFAQEAIEMAEKVLNFVKNKLK